MTSTARRPRVRPTTWAILAWMVVSIAAILGAWQGSASRMGAVPEITVATGTDRVVVAPFQAGYLGDWVSVTNPAGHLEVGDLQTVMVTFPREMRAGQITVLTERGPRTEQLTLPAGADQVLRIPAVTPAGRLTHLAVQSAPVVYDSAGDESVLIGEWAVEFVPSTAD